MQLITLYDWSDLLIQDIYDVLSSNYSKLFGVPDIVIVRSGDGSGNKESRSKDLNKQLKKLGCNTAQSSLELYTGIADYDDPEKSWETYFNCSIKEFNRKSCVIACRNEIFSSSDIVDFMSKVAARSHIGYGFAGVYAGSGEGRYYAGGVSTGTSTKEESASNGRWTCQRLPMKGAPAENKHLQGYFRDIYEVNVLNLKHVANLNKFFPSEHNFINIRKISEDNYLWLVNGKDHQAIRNKLEAENLLI